MAEDRLLGERELDVMAILWTHGSGTVGEVKRRLSAKLAYTTVLTILRNLETKRYVRHEEEGRAHRYFPRVAQGAAQKSALTRLIDTLFHGSPGALVARLVDDHDVSPADLQKLAAQLDKRGARRRGAR
ncbi:MAG: BlaI/MecI/CopY family transcriptional regulator [Gemmatimonadales bacterium]